MKRWILILLPLVLLGSMIAWRLDQKRSEVEAQAEQRAARMQGPAVASLAVVQMRDVFSTFEATGSIEAPMSVKIAPKITGRIELLEVREGDRIRKGQVLVRIDSSEVEAGVQQRMAEVAEAKYRLAQAKLNLAPTDVAVNTQIRQFKAAVASAEADFTQVQESLEADIQAAAANVNDAEARVGNARAAVSSAEANADNARIRHDRIYNLYEQGYIAAQDVDDAKATLAVQRAAVEVAQGQLRSAEAQRDAVQQRLRSVKAKGKADIEASRAKLTQAKASLEHASANTSQKSAYRQSISALEAGVAAAEAALDSAQARRQDTVLASPLDGYVTGRFADPGAIASPSQPVISVQFVKDVWVTAAVPEEVCAKLHLGQEVRIRLDAIPERTFTASIVQINPSADPQSRQFTVRAALSNFSGQLKPGMFARVAFETDRIPRAVVVPREAIQRDRDGQVVILVDDEQKAKRTPVRVGAESGEFVSILDGLKPGDRVVTMSSMPIRDGQSVTDGGEGRPRGERKNGAGRK